MMMKRLLLLIIANLLFMAVTAFATFVIIKNDGTIVRLDVEKLPVEQSGESFTINGIDVNDIAHIYNKVWNKYDDYERAFKQGYLSSKYYTYDRKKQITSQEFKAMLKPMIEKFRPDSIDYFNNHITDYNAPLTRGMAACMAYYVARCINVETANINVVLTLPEDMWSDWDYDVYLKVFPYIDDAGEEDYPEDKYWRSTGFGTVLTPWMWNHNHWSDYSNIQVIAMDFEAVSYHWSNAFTWEDAVRAVTRLYDSINKEIEIEYVDIDDPRVTTPDPSLFTNELLTYAAAKEVESINDLPRLYGIPVSGGGAGHEFYTVFNLQPIELEEMADWGFNSVRFTCSFLLLFSRDVSKANLTYLQKLDQLVATAMECGLHMTFCFFDVPGCIQYLTEDTYSDYELDFDILNTEKRQQARKVWHIIATRYKDVPNVNLSFYPASTGMLMHPEGFGIAEGFTFDEVCEWNDFLIDAIREISPQRFIRFEAIKEDLDLIDFKAFEDKTRQTYHHVKHVMEKYDNVRPVIGHMDMAYGFATYQVNAGSLSGGGNIDFAQHSAYIPTYPARIYCLNERIGGNENKLTLDGCLPKGTVIDFYLAKAEPGTLTFAADGTTLHQESFDKSQDFKVGYYLNFACPFAESDKKVEIVLTDDVNEIIVTADGEGWFTWSGISVTLPEQYTVEKWRYDHQWDVELGILAPEDFHQEFYKKATSTVQIGVFGNSDGGNHITIHDNVTYSSESILYESSAESYDLLMKNVTDYYPRWTFWNEDINITDNESVLRFFDDMMAAAQKYNVDVWCAVQGNMMNEYYAPYHNAGYEGEEFGRHHNFNVKLLRILQKYMDK